MRSYEFHIISLNMNGRPLPANSPRMHVVLLPVTQKFNYTSRAEDLLGSKSACPAARPPSAAVTPKEERATSGSGSSEGRAGRRCLRFIAAEKAEIPMNHSNKAVRRDTPGGESEGSKCKQACRQAGRQAGRQDAKQKDESSPGWVLPRLRASSGHA